MQSYILIDAENPCKDNIKEELSKFEFTIDDVKDVNGGADILAKLIVDSPRALKNFIFEQLEKIDGIRRVIVI